MKLLYLLSFPITALAAALPATTQPTDAQNLATCAKKNPELLQAIHNFCQKTDIVVPSGYGQNGARVGNNMAWIWPQDGCPVNWVPQYWCKVQFHAVCAAGDDNGYGGAYFGLGSDKCQVFLLDTVAVHEDEVKDRIG